MLSPVPDIEPELSVVVLMRDDYEAVRPLVRALQRQSAREKIEVVLCSPGSRGIAVPTSDFDRFAGHQNVALRDLRSTATARASGVRAARGRVVAFAEDHCLPHPAWAEAILDRHRGAWSGVGPVFRNGNPGNRVSRANFLIEYGDWAAPHPGGEIDHIPGHNSTYKRAALLEYGADLDSVLEAESPMQWEMRSRGHRFFLEPRARVHHWNFSLLAPSLRLRFWGGRLFAANRARSWGLARRGLYAIASPLIPVVRLRRLLRALGRLEEEGQRGGVLAVSFVLLLADGFGEFLGYAVGGGSAMDHLSDWGEFRRGDFLLPRERVDGRDGAARVAFP